MKKAAILAHPGAGDFRADFPRRLGRFALGACRCRSGRHTYDHWIGGQFFRIRVVRVCGRLWFRVKP